MRVTKKGGQFVVEDEPIVLTGEPARKVRAALEERDRTGNTDEQKRFLAECERVYRGAKR
jgi:hypothetical protein